MAKKINMLMMKSYQIKAEIDKLTSQREKANELLMNEMKSQKITTIENDTAKATMNTKVTINFDKFKLQENLPSKVYRKIIDKVYYVTDVKAFKKLMKEYGVPMKELKECMLVKEEVNEDTIDRLTESGDITKKMLKGTFEKKVTRYITMKEK